jgi:hypothetical protein
MRMKWIEPSMLKAARLVRRFSAERLTVAPYTILLLIGLKLIYDGIVGFITHV